MAVIVGNACAHALRAHDRVASFAGNYVDGRTGYTPGFTGPMHLAKDARPFNEFDHSRAAGAEGVGVQNHGTVARSSYEESRPCVVPGHDVAALGIGRRANHREAGREVAQARVEHRAHNRLFGQRVQDPTLQATGKGWNLEFVHFVSRQLSTWAEYAHMFAQAHTHDHVVSIHVRQREHARGIGLRRSCGLKQREGA